MQTGTYNKAVYWPNEIEQAIKFAMTKRYVVLPTQHYRLKARTLMLPDNCYRALLHGKIVEAEVNDGCVVKVITRLRNRYNHTQDICGAIALDGIEARVKTVWTNRCGDKHWTIRKENYVQS